MTGETSSSGDRRLDEVTLWSLAAAVLAVAVFVPSLWNGFAYDDLPIIAQNQNLRSLSGLGELLTQPYWPGERGVDFGLWRPTTSFVLSIIWQASGGAALAFHLANVLLHGAVAALVVRVVSRLLPVAVAGVAGLVFAVHPVHVEAVANGVGISELIAALLILLALDLVALHDRLTRRETISVLALYALAFGAKESAIVLPGLVFVVDGVRRRLDLGDAAGWLKDRALLLVGMVGVAGGMLWARTRVLGGIADAMPALGADILPEIPRIFTLGEIWTQTLRLITVPTWLSPDYAPGVIPIVTRWTGTALLGVGAVLGLLALALVSMGAVRRAADPAETRGRAFEGRVATAAAVPLGVLWFVTSISPASNALFVTGVLLAERTLYLPSVGAAIVVAGLIVPAVTSVAVNPRIRLAAASALLLLGLIWTTRTVTYIPAWRDHASIFQHMVDVVPESGRSQWVMGDTRLGSGDLEGAMTHYRIALGLLGPEYAFLTEVARRQIAEGRARVALPFLTRAVDARPDEAAALQLLAVATSQLERWGETESWARAAAEADPEDATAHHLLSVALARQERWAEAAEARVRMIALDPGPWQPWFWLAEVRGRAGDRAGARAAADSVRARTDAATALGQVDSLATALGFAQGG